MAASRKGKKGGGAVGFSDAQDDLVDPETGKGDAMARLADSSGNMVSGSVCGFGFSGVRPERLGETEYTLVTVVLDRTGSVAGFEKELAGALQGAVGACAKSPRADNLLLRYVTFANDVTEVFGFTPMGQVDAAQVAVPVCSGGTALRDAVFSASSAANAYGKSLFDADFRVNAVSFVITDGDDNGSSLSADAVKAELERGRRDEFLESAQSFLIGVNATSYRNKLADVASSCGMDGYEDAGSVTPGSLAKLAAFISRSVSQASVSMSTGAAQSGSQAGSSSPVSISFPAVAGTP